MRSTFTNTQKDKDFMKSIIDVLSSDKRPTHIPTQINEKLDYDEAEEVEYGWNTMRPQKTQDAIDHVFGDKQRLEFPLHRSDDVPHPDVEEHLNKHGYAITDYVGGKAKDKFNREVNIGKALTKTKAEDHIKAAYDNDPTRQQQKANLKVVITHRPVDVAGMTSGHQSWVDQSCMNFHKGAYRHHLKDDVYEGTHVAYLTDHEDNDLDRPVARIAVKPYHADDGHTIFRPEQKTYGNASSSFQKSVNDWFEEKYPAHDNETYTKNNRVYDDTGHDTYESMTKDAADDYIDRGERITSSVPHHIINHIAHRLINQQTNGSNSDIMNHYAKTRHDIAFNRNQVNALYKVAKDHGQTDMAYHLASTAGDTLNKENLQHAIQNYPSIHTVLRHKYLPSEFVDSLSAEKLGSVHPSNIKPRHVDKVVDAYANKESGSWYSLRDMTDKLTPDHLHKILNRPSNIDANGNDFMDASDVNFISRHPKADSSVMNSLYHKVKNSPSNLKVFNANNKMPTPEHVAGAKTSDDLNSIMANAKDKLTHNLALHKAIGLSKEGASHVNRISLGENSEKYLSDSDISDLYDNSHRLNAGTFPDGVHERLLNHAFNKINETHAKLHPKDMFDEDPDDYEHSDEYKEAYEENQDHFDKHASLIDDKLSDMRGDFRNDESVNYNYFDKLDGHIGKARNHDGHDGSHDDVRSDHHDLNQEIENHNNW